MSRLTDIEKLARVGTRVNHLYDQKREIAKHCRRADRARNAPGVTCPASRHLHTIASALASGETYHMLIEDPKHCAITMLAVLESLWRLRAKEKPRMTTFDIGRRHQ